MKKNKIIYVLVSSLAITLTASLSSCANGEAKKWAYTKDEMSDFLSMDAIQKDNNDNTITFSADTDVEIFDETIDHDDVIVFNKDKVKEELEKSNKDYADYSVLKKASVDVVDIKNLDDKDGFHITFKNEDNSSNYGMLLFSSVSTIDKFTMVSKFEEKKNDGNKDPQAEFEEKYVSSKGSWEDGGKYTVSIISNIAVSLAGAFSGNPAAFVTGIFGIFSTIVEGCSDKEASIQDVMNQLKETDKKIDELSNKIDKNTQLLQEEIVRTNANVDQANLNVLNLAINDFANNAISPINKFNRNLSDDLKDYYKDFISKEETIKLALRDTKNGYESIPLSEISDESLYNTEISITDFTNAKKFLASNNDIIKNGFIEELAKDIENALSKNTKLPSNVTLDTANQFVRARIIENFTKEYFSSHREKAQEYRNLIIDLAERIAGINGRVNYLNSYLSRLQYMYNFQGEIKSLIRSFCTNLLKILDINNALATLACLYAKYDYEDLKTVYKAARDQIQNFYKVNNEKDDTYSFITQSTLTGAFYQSKYNPTYSNLGNEPSLKVNFETKKIEKNGNAVKTIDDDISKHEGISESNHLRISTRWNLLKNVGDTSTTNDYLHYLSSNKVISSNSIEAAEFLFGMKSIDSSCYRILTNDRNERDLNSTDSSLKLKCVGRGNPDGDYFGLNNEYNYRSQRESSCWSGKMFEAKFIGAESGTSLGKQSIASWARYSESHWYWRNDEYWAFVNNDIYNYYFIIESVQK